MIYNVVSRPKLARNKYGEVEKVTGVSGTSYFSGTAQSGGTSSDVQIDTFKGSTATEDGIQGLVPAPKCNVNEPLGSLNDNKKFLKGTGAWVDIPISRYTTENPNKDGIKLEGNLHVTDTLSTQTLNVTGAAHFWELVIDKVRSTSGNLLITPANFHVDMVGEDIEYPVDPAETPYAEMFYDENEETGIYGLEEIFSSNNIDSMTATRLYMRNDDGNMNTVPTMEIGDMVRCKTFNVDDLGTHNIHNKDYWTFVMNVGTETVDDISYIYIDVFKEYTADGVTYGLGTTVTYQEPPIDTHLTLHEEDMEIGADYMCEVGQLFIATSDKSSGNCEISLPNVNGSGNTYEGVLTWDGSKWVFGDWGTGEEIYLNDSFDFNEDSYYKGHLECVQDSRWTDPVIKIYARDNNIFDSNNPTLDSIMYAWGTFYTEDEVEQSNTISLNSVTPRRARALVDNFVPMSKERMLAVDEIDTTESGEYYVGNSTTIPSGTTLSADVMTSDGTVYSAGTTLVNELILDKGDIVILDGTNDLTSFGSDVEFTSGESEVLTTGNEGTTDVVSSETSVTSADIAIEEFTFGYGTFEPAEGDDIVALGHLWSGDRQDAILIAACDPMDAELTPPAIAQYRGIKTFESLSKYRTNTLSAGGNEFTGRFLVDYNGYYIDINEKLNLFVSDLTSGLEKVGIHLDGENSTIKLVGSVEIRQNHDGTTDTLTVWDEDDKLRVQISPDEIPAKANISSSINPTYNSYFNSISGMRYPTGATWERHTYTEFIWSWDHEWQYYVASESSSSSPAYFRFTTTDSLGNYNAGEKITLDDYWANISTVAYFKGSTRMTNRGTNQQSISSVILRFQCNRGSGWATISSFNLTNSATINLWDEFVSIEYNNMLLNNYTLPYTGAYRVEMEIVYNVYASIVFKGKSGKQSNPYILFNCGVRGGLNVISPSNSMTRIGSNGILFNTSNTGQYFYSGNDGIEMKWGDVGVSLDQYGYRRYKKVYTVATSGTSASSKYGYSIPFDADVIFVTGSNVQINTHAWSGIPEGKEIIVVGNSTTTYGTAEIYTSRERKHLIYHSQEWWEI